jgi:hypothetical protein
VCPAAERDDRIVLNDEPRIRLAVFGDRRMQRTLQRPHLAVRAPSEIYEPDGRHVRCALSV